MQKIAMGKDSKSDELMDGDVLDYPIALYSKINARLMLLLISMIPIILGFFMLFMANVEQRWVLFNVGCVFLFFGMIGCFIAIKNKKSKRPILVIDESGLSILNYYNLITPDRYLWDYIQSMKLERLKNIGGSRWVLKIQLKVGNTIKLPLLPLCFNDTSLNQEEVFRLIEQTYHRQPVIYRPVSKEEMRPAKLDLEDIKEVIKGVGMICIGIAIAFVIQQFM